MNSRTHGFTIDRIRKTKKTGTVYEMTHDKTGAKLIWVDNGQENKLFGVAFKTVPENDTGVFHILEHSVLCGSEKYPVREPFLELLKGSMNTFLNAMTYPDKTIYPVSSRNEKDYLNLTGVYLDAVFAPLLLEKRHIFYQEGKRLEAGEDGPSYNGVVLNEMKGAMSEVDRVIEEGIDSLLFPESCYRFNSGGEPKAITSLTYEEFRDTYKKFYHPSNAIFYLDGDLPIDKTLEMIDGYIGGFDKLGGFPEIAMQKPVNASATGLYGTDETEGERDIAAFAKIICRYDDVKKLFAVQLLTDVLAASNDSPLKRAVLSAGIAEDMDLTVADEIQQPYIELILRNMNSERTAEAKELILNTVKKLVKEGIPKEELTAALNKLEFSMREIPEPQAIYRASAVLASQLYGGDPLIYLETDEVFGELRRMVETDGFEKLLSEIFLDEEGLVTLTLTPSNDVAEKNAEEEKIKAENEYNALSDEEKKVLELENEELRSWQQTPDSPEALATIPLLSLSDVDPEPKHYNTEEYEKEGVKFLWHKAATNGVTHVSLYMPLTAFDLKELEVISILTLFYKELPTKKHDTVSLQREIKTYIGSLGFSVSVFSQEGNTEECTPYLVANASVLDGNIKKAEELISEILLETDISDSTKILEILKQVDEMNRQSAVSSGHILAMSASMAGYSAAKAAIEAMNGYSFSHRVRGMVQDFEEGYKTLSELFPRVTGMIGKKSMTVSVTSDIKGGFDGFTEYVPEGSVQPERRAYKTSVPFKSGIKIPGAVSYAVKAFSQKECGRGDEGSFSVMANIVSLSYLWNKVRVQGGAYGTGLNETKDGFFCYSYRDPSAAATLKTYGGISDFLREFAKSGEELDKYIISAIASNDPLTSPRGEGIIADRLYFNGRTDELRRKYRKEMLETDMEDLLSWTAVMDKMAENGAVCVVGGSAALTEAAALAECEGLEMLEI